MKSRSLPILAATLALAAVLAAAAEGAWGQGMKSAVRLLAAGVGPDGRLAAGIEIVMPPGWHTYWRSPGDAGIAPVIDFSASKNLASAEVSFPVPTRLDDGFSVTNVYDDRVVLPVSAVVPDPSAPVDLVLAIELGVCEEVCVVDKVAARLTAPAGADDAGVAATLAEARALVPAPAEPGVFSLDSVARDGGTDKRPVFRLSGVVPDPAAAEMFVEGPPDWSPYPAEFKGEDGGTAAWTVKFSRLGATAPLAGARFRVTIVSAGRAVEQTIGAN